MYFPLKLSLACGCSLLALLLASSDCTAQVEKLTDEAQLIAILTGEEPKADKAMACKRLAVYGSEQAVPALAELLSDPQLASWTRIALEAIPGSAADDALRTACDSLTGNLLVGAVNSLGVRRDAQSVATLAKLLESDDLQVAEAAAIALGKIGGQPAADALRPRLAHAADSVRSAVAEGCVLCAERLAAEGSLPNAFELYEQVRTTGDLPTQRIVEATRGAILSQPEKGISLLIDALRSPERALFHVALQTAREMPSPELANALLAEVRTAGADRAPLIVLALADMPGAVDADTIIQLARQAGSKEVRLAALGAIGRTGDASCVAPLLEIAAEAEDLYAPVKAALVEVPDEAINAAIVGRLAQAPAGPQQQVLLEVIGLRRIQAVPQLIQALDSPQANIRAAALESLGSTIPQEQLELLIDQAISPAQATDATTARQALKAAAIRMPDREAAAAQIAAAIPAAPAAAQVALVEILGAMGGPQALMTLGELAGSGDTQLKDAASRLLGEWMTIDAAPVLLELATTGPADKFQGRAMKGYIRIARQFVMPEADRVRMCRQALQAAKQDAERQLVLDVLERYPSVGMLKLAIEAAKMPRLQPAATKTAQAIAAKLGDDPAAAGLMKEAGLHQ